MEKKSGEVNRNNTVSHPKVASNSFGNLNHMVVAEVLKKVCPGESLHGCLDQSGGQNLCGWEHDPVGRTIPQRKMGEMGEHARRYNNMTKKIKAFKNHP